MDNYDKYLDEQFGQLEINLVKHDTSPNGYPCYIEAHLGKKPKDMGQVALDLSNYIYRRTGLRYQSMPEYIGKGKSTSIRWFMSWDNIAPYCIQIQEKFGFKAKIEKYLPFEFQSLIIQNPKRGVKVA